MTFGALAGQLADLHKHFLQADIATLGTADSLHKASHVMRTRKALEVYFCCLSMVLEYRVYDHYRLACSDDNHPPVSFDSWSIERKQNGPQFQFWTIVMELELCILRYVRSLREANFAMYVDALTELVPWFFALEHTNYARWIPVHLRDMVALPTDRPRCLAKSFNAWPLLTVQKTECLFSSIPIDQAHEQTNALVNDDVGAVVLTEIPSALRRWMRCWTRGCLSNWRI